MMQKRIVICIVSLFLLGGVMYATRHYLRNQVSIMTAHLGVHYADFPETDNASLTPLQQSILNSARVEYAKHPVSYNSNVLKYTNNNQEAWCANFSSWVMKQVGVPYKNPNSGGWRIPGVLTLQTYYKQSGRYVVAGDYKPQAGDVAFYIRQTRLFPRQHVAIIVKVDGDRMITLGGNDGGKMLLRNQSINSGDDLVGFGKLQQ